MNELFSDVLIGFSGFLRPYLSELGLAMMATLLVIYGKDILNVLKQQIGGLNILLKLTLFIVFCAVGFGLLTSLLTPWLISLLAGVDDLWLGLAVLVVFYFIGFLAKKRGVL
ncbi:DUF3392 domain-containing protein [Thiomicrospira cyclica]|uniref:DUF3392 domain-containing protein n=1 Tax=Thiomicrospira cyclica (strain DSM 14477 / JCM 11371 / ALM1) TaxID=717773 RepID=F6D925_THICA|nr:DUF3392 domain-containing protein [Thiomicrospira cyclica]AEG30856.1 hypothetical protein Thicy_0080 [Thiomicrospira cyclica ALM1]